MYVILFYVYNEQTKLELVGKKQMSTGLFFPCIKDNTVFDVIGFQIPIQRQQTIFDNFLFHPASADLDANIFWDEIRHFWEKRCIFFDANTVFSLLAGTEQRTQT